MRRLRKITAAERKIMPRSRNVPKKTDFIISRQPLWPRLKCNSRGHHSDTGEGVRIASATTWEKTKRKQSTGLIFGILDQHLQPLEAIKAITTANKRLWVGPRWKKLPLPWTTSPIKTSMSGKLVRTTTHPRTLQKLPFLFDFSQRSWMARPTAVCPRGKGTEEHLTVLDLWLQIADFRFRIWDCGFRILIHLALSKISNLKSKTRKSACLLSNNNRATTHPFSKWPLITTT